MQETTHTHLCAHARTHTHTHTHTLTHTRTDYTGTDMYDCLKSQKSKHLDLQTDWCRKPHTHTYAHTHARTHTHAHTHKKQQETISWKAGKCESPQENSKSLLQCLVKTPHHKLSLLFISSTLSSGLCCVDCSPSVLIKIPGGAVW